MQKHPSLLNGIPDSLDGVIPSKATAIATGTTTVAYRAGQDDGQWGDKGVGGDGGGVMDTSGDKGARGGQQTVDDLVGLFLVAKKIIKYR